VDRYPFSRLAPTRSGADRKRRQIPDRDDGQDESLRYEQASAGCAPLFRAINERIRELEGNRLIGEYGFCCECEDETCTGVLRLTAQEYEFVRTEASWFAVLPGHEEPADEVVSRADRFVVVSKADDGQGAQTRVVSDRVRAQGTYTGLRLYGRLMGEARPYWRQIGALLALGLLSSVFALLTPLPLAIAVDCVVGSRPLPGFLAVAAPAGVKDSQTAVLFIAAALFVLLALLKQLQQFGNLVLSTTTSERLLLQFRSHLFRHAERLSLAYHDARGTGDSTYRIQYDATAIPNVAVTGLIPFVTAAVTVVGMIYVTAKIDWRLALVSLTVAPILFLAMRIYRKRLRAQWHDAKRLESRALSVVQESLEALRVVKAFGREDHARDRFVESSAESVRAKIGLSYVEGRFGILVGATIGLGTGTVLFMGTRQVLAGAITLGELVLVMGYLQQLYDPLKTASRKVGTLQSSLASVERVYTLLDEAPDFVDPPNARPLARAVGAITFENVSFAYHQGQRVLDDVSFELAPGTRLGIAGTTGAGKTTLVSLLTRFYDPGGGRILLDGVDLRRYKLPDLRDQFAIVLQEPVLFSTSIGENILYARPGADADDVIAAAKAASAHDFISELPEGYDTPVGERGVRLSGGERQRIALARAFLKDAPILILDEPTSSVDARTEGEILEAMERLMRGRTALMIAHRTSTLEICDRRLDLEHGRVVRLTPSGSRPMLPMAPAVLPAGDRPTRRRRREHLPVSCDPVGHPAVAAWREVAPARSRVDLVELLRGKDKRQIYRLTLGGDGSRVIAKRARGEALVPERTIYEHVLPWLPTPTLRYFGFVGEGDDGFAWLFVEDAGDERCSLAEHGELAADWLGTLHGAAAELDLAAFLPARGADHYLEHLRSARGRIRAKYADASVTGGDRDMLRRLLATCELIESSWNNVEAMCKGLPDTLVHGDLVAKNLRLRSEAAGPAIFAFDWECAGFGVPAADVHELTVGAPAEQLTRYRSTVAGYAGRLNEAELWALLFLGGGFRLLASVDWATPHLRFPRPERGMATLGCYEPPLRSWADALAEAA
jgi:ATP-binding cassette subfamily B protein